MSVTLLEVWRAARARSVPFSGESAGFMVFALCEATAQAPRSLGLNDADLAEDGSLRLLSNRGCSAQQAETEMRTLLGRLLEVASSPGPSLFKIAGRAGGSSLSALAEEIEKALIPLNRAAARRALVRLFRETARAVAQGKLGAAPDLDEPAPIRLSPPPPAVAPKKAEPPALKTQPTAPTVAPSVEAVRGLTAPLPPVVRRSPVPPPLAAPAAPEPEHLTSPETVVARRARGIRSVPPPLPEVHRGERTPPMGSVDVAVISVPRAVLSEVLGDTTERAPDVVELVLPENDDAELRALAAWPVASPRSSSPDLPQFELSPDSANRGAT
ncbi:MAG: hypothetical protein QM756_26365 [Polyangiaceae bacterium]